MDSVRINFMKHSAVVLATDNRHKAAEFASLLQGDCELRTQSEFAVTTPPETGATFEENAIIKARHACLATELPALADDSGLEVAALGGAPGVFSSRYAGEDADDAANLAKLLRELAKVADDNPAAEFRCAIAYIEPAMERPLVVSSAWKGVIVREPRGEHGFGYDPVFYVPEKRCTAAQLPPGVKNQISHRASALKQLQAIFTAVCRART